MYCIIPDPYPDELLYSTLARYRIWTDISAARDVQEFCFGTRSMVSSYDLPCHINQMIQSLPPTYGYNAEQLIKEHTLFPFYTAFMGEDRRADILKCMKENCGGRLHTKIGIMASVVRESPYFRYCPLCATRFLEEHGELYWNRIHQTPGVEACPVHGILLRNSCVPVRGHYRGQYFPAEIDDCPITELDAVPADEIWQAMAIDIEMLYRCEVPIDLDIFNRRMKEALQQLGCTSGAGRLRIKRLEEILTEVYPKAVLEKLFREGDIQHVVGRLVDVIRGNRHASHTLYYMILMRMFFGGLHGYLSSQGTPKEWYPCFNAASDHYGQLVVSDVVAKRWKRGRDFWHYRCSCGFSYSAERLSPAPQRIRVIEYGPLWEAKLNALALEGNSLRSMMRILKADAKTIRNHLAASHRIPPDGSFEDQKTLNQSRESWLCIISASPGVGIKAIRMEHQALYIWLYRHDYDWLRKNSPKESGERALAERVNWSQRDEAIRLQLEGVCQELLELRGKPIRITKNRLASMAGVRAVVQHHIDKMPQCQSFLGAVCESEEQYRLRRVPWAVKVCISAYPRPAPWQIYRRLGLKSSPSAEVARAVKVNLQMLTGDTVWENR